MEDNEYLNMGYELQFRDMDEAERLKNVEGNWDVSQSNFFRKFDKKIHVIHDVKKELLDDEQLEHVKEGKEFPYYFEVYGALDWGFYPDYASLGIWFVGDEIVHKRYQVNFNGKYIVEMPDEDGKLVEKGTMAINEASKFIKYLETKYDIEFKAIAIPHDMAMKGEKYMNSKGEIIGETKETVMRFYGLNTVVTRGSRSDGWDMIHKLQADKTIEGKPLVTYHASCVETISEYQTLARDEKKWVDIKDGQIDHDADSDRYFANMYTRFLNKKHKVKVEESFREKMFKKHIKQNKKIKTIDFDNFIR
jgi:hypothetical protein